VCQNPTAVRVVTQSDVPGQARDALPRALPGKKRPDGLSIVLARAGSDRRCLIEMGDRVVVSVAVRPPSFSPSSSALHPGSLHWAKHTADFTQMPQRSKCVVQLARPHQGRCAAKVFAGKELDEAG
jgi:hypothetical protein